MKKSKSNINRDIRDVFSIQGASILKARSFVGKEFKAAVEAILRSKGKVVVTGIGKSGIIAQKIASTLTSTGTPAIYLDPVEALHGSLGIIQKQDILFAIGKSGESEELLNLIPSVNQIGAKIICLTARPDSSLSKQSAIALCIPIEREACPLNLAPTTSSTIALVVGDAIAIALMKLRGFGEEHFAAFHPGGLLGRRLLLKVSDVMRKGRRNPVVDIDDTMVQLLVEISNKWTGAASVVDKKMKFVGLVTDYDIRQAFARGETITSLSIRQIMNSKPTFVYDDELAVKALEKMEARKKPLSVLPVIDRQKRSVGMIHLHDLVSKGLLPEHANNA